MSVKKTKNEDSSVMDKIVEADASIKAIPKVGDVIKGAVISASRKEVLIDYKGAMTGLIRGKELYDEAEEFSNLKPGDEVEATVLELENEQGMLELSFRYAGRERTWSVLQEYKIKGETIIAKINDANKGGLLVTVNNVIGFLPVSQLSPEFYPRVQGGDKNKILERLKGYIGQKFNVKVLDIDAESEKLIVSEKAAWEETQKDILGKYKIGDVVEGAITAVTDFGAFLEFGEKLEGLVHISELAWQRIDNPSDLFKVGDKIQAEIIKIDGSKIFLSSKKLKKDPWANINEKYKIGDIVDGEILKITPFGLFIKLDEDIHGLAHISELSDKKVANVETVAKAGEMMKFRIVSIEPEEHRLGLSMKSLTETADSKSETEKPEVEKPGSRTELNPTVETPKE